MSSLKALSMPRIPRHPSRATAAAAVPLAQPRPARRWLGMGIAAAGACLSLGQLVHLMAAS